MFEDKKLVILDLDGTLLDTTKMWNEVDDNIMSFLTGDRKLNKGIFEQSIYSLFPDSFIEYSKHLKDLTGTNFSVEEIHLIRKSIALYYLLNVAKFKPNALDFVRDLKDRGYILAVASMTSKWAIEMYKNNPNIDLSMFDFILTREDVQNGKPSPDIINKIIQLANVSKNETILIEDSLQGVKAGVNASVDVISIYDKAQEKNSKVIEMLSTYKVKDFEELESELVKTKRFN